jgi:hypothetical protein
MTKFQFLMAVVVCGAVSAVGAAARADVVINPGESIFVSSPQSVSCSKPAPIPTPTSAPTSIPAPSLRVCDCMFDANALPVGQAVGTQGNDLISQCQSINQNADPFNCKVIPYPSSGALTCNCMFSANASPVGQAVGIIGSDLIKQCQLINQNAAPFNCSSN